MEHVLPKLPYAYDSLEPYIDARTMEIHYTKHHAGYVSNLNAALAKQPNLADLSLEELLKNLGAVNEEIREAVRNNAGGHYNHSLFWQVMTSQSAKIPVGDLAEAINQTFGGFDQFKELFSKAALARFGSGWAWLNLDRDKKLIITSSSNQDNPFSSNQTPIFGLDVWEHAYYLKYQNRRGEYIENWWNLVDWSALDERFKELSA